MNKVTVIYGPVASGKTTKAAEIVNGRNSETFINYLFENELRHVVNERAGLTGVSEAVAIFDEVKARHVPRLVALINSNSLLLRKPYTPKAQYYERPEMIILTADSRLVQDKAFGTGDFIKYIDLNNRY